MGNVKLANMLKALAEVELRQYEMDKTIEPLRPDGIPGKECETSGLLQRAARPAAGIHQLCPGRPGLRHRICNLPIKGLPKNRGLTGPKQKGGPQSFAGANHSPGPTGGERREAS